MGVLRLFLCGDVMTGRGIDQVLPHPCEPTLHEDFVESALRYVHLAEAVNGPIPRPVEPSYIWGTALDELARSRPDARIVNLETSVTRSDDYFDKGINYRMSPENAACLSAAAIDCCVLANNHVLDWGRGGLLETLATLQRLGIATAGAGRNRAEAETPAVLPVKGKGRVLVFAYALASSGTPREWAAKADTLGVNFLPDVSAENAERVRGCIERWRRPGDVVVVSLHWGPNWGYGIADEETRFARALIDDAGVSVVHGHSSHHAKAIEIYRDRLVLYGCGDFLNDYEGIEGYENYRDDLVLMYFADVDSGSGKLVAAELVPLRIERFRLVPPSPDDTEWLRHVLDRESGRFGVRVAASSPHRLSLAWASERAPPSGSEASRR
jgi:poly-gamma-glutamate capsule biosynthesis protein CapA/YwtB (metallophosphatase superfamily)